MRSERDLFRHNTVVLPISLNFIYILGLLSGGAMGLWHGCEHYEQEKINDAVCDLPSCPTELFVKKWHPRLLEATTFKYDWSYIVSWIGVGMTLCSAILFFLAAVCIKNDKQREEAMNLQYLMPGNNTLICILSVLYFTIQFHTIHRLLE